MSVKKLFKNIPTVYPIDVPTNFPSGIAVKTEKATYWIKDNKRYKLISERAAKSWSFETVRATENSLSTTKLAGRLGFRDGTLIKNIADGKIYLVSQNKRRHLVTMDSFDKYGLDRSKVIEAGIEEIEIHEIGEDI